jgi:dihydroflavonol-4-reductase
MGIMGGKKLVLGATGFVGSAVMRELLKDGNDVKVVLRKSSNTANLDPFDVERVYADMTDTDSMKKALEDCDTLFITAAYFAHWAPNPKKLYEVNVGGTKATLQAALEAGIEKVVYTSTNNTIGAHGAPPVDENEDFNQWDIDDDYSKSKYLAEIEAYKYGARGVPIVIVNPTFVIGTNDVRPTPSGRMIIDVASGKEQLYMDARTNIIDVDDVARGEILAAQKGRVGERYILGNTNVNIPEFYRLIAEIAGVQAPKIKVPYPLALLAGHIFTTQAAITGNPPFVTAGEVKIGHRGEWYDCSKAVNELGMPLTPLPETIKKAINWFRENGYLPKAESKGN